MRRWCLSQVPFHSRCFGSAASRVRPREIQRQSLRRQAESEVSGMLLIVFMLVVPAWFVVGWSPGFMAQKEHEQAWALNLHTNRADGAPRHYTDPSEKPSRDL